MDRVHSDGRGGNRHGDRSVKFERMSTWAEISECGRYTVSASMHADGLSGKGLKRFLFTAWLRNPGDEPPSILLVDRDAEKCRAKCREHAAAQVLA